MATPNTFYCPILISVAKQDMLSKLQQKSIPFSILAAMSKVPREDFIRGLGPGAYDFFEHPHPIGPGSFMYSPLQIAQLLKLSEVQLGQQVLVLGSRDDGYLAAVLSHLVGPDGMVIAVENNPERLDRSIKNLHELNYSVSVYNNGNWRKFDAEPVKNYFKNVGLPPMTYDQFNIGFVWGDLVCGFRHTQRFDLILSSTVMPDNHDALLKQIADTGRIVIPVRASKQIQVEQQIKIASNLYGRVLLEAGEKFVDSKFEQPLRPKRTKVIPDPNFVLVGHIPK